MGGRRGLVNQSVKKWKWDDDSILVLAFSLPFFRFSFFPFCFFAFLRFFLSSFLPLFFLGIKQNARE